jgi:hypothetical protein
MARHAVACEGTYTGLEFCYMRGLLVSVLSLLSQLLVSYSIKTLRIVPEND